MFPCFTIKHQLRIVSPRRNSIFGIVLRHIYPKKFIKIFLEPVNWNELIKNPKNFSSVLFYGLGLVLRDDNLLQMFMQIGIFIDLIKWDLSGVSSTKY